MGELLASDVQHLFHAQDYTRLRALVDEGKALHKFCYRADKPHWWSTVLGLAINELDVYMVQYILQKHGPNALTQRVISGGSTGYGNMAYTLIIDHRWETRRSIEVILETALELGGFDVHDNLRALPQLRYIADIYQNSREAQLWAATAVVWCCQAIRKAHGLADGVGLLVGERVWSESVWEYEPKIKRAKY